jgi:tripartite-type tricarboxylate transporter receptor subunit TctC
MLDIRLTRTALAAALLVAATGIATAQAPFPSKAVRIVIPYPAGGGTDVLGRLVADQLSRRWGQPVIVENIGGAGGNIGAADVARSKPDGYTLMVAAPGPISTNAFLYKEMAFDPKRWSPVALLSTGAYVLTVRPNFEGTTVKDLIARAKAKPGMMTAAIPGIGTVGHLATVQLEMLADIKIAQIPYRGLGPAVNDIIAGHIDMMFDTPTTSLPLHRDGRVKILATGTPERVREFPEIPTIAESGVPGYRTITWYAMVAPPNTPRELTEKINRDVSEILERPDIIERVRAIQMEPATKSVAEVAAFFADESELWGKVIKAANIPMQ